MPLYEFDCPHCGAQFERITSLREPILCPECCAPECVRRFPLISGHIWRGSVEGASPRKDKHAELDRRAAKRERVTTMIDKQSEKLNGSWQKK